ncbi:MAG: DUF1127 domain-containing protein [Planktotalea sp.]|uniref:DUF1127 domain-containing protein n=1 Tax=Planktotalea sp. TaxID=2029877 RepID=UPI003C72D834
MAVLDFSAHGAASLRSRIAAGLRSGLESFVRARTRAAEFEYFQNLSDSELAAKGLRREDIAMHIFRDYNI